jgi:hypothetical protein
LCLRGLRGDGSMMMGIHCNDYQGHRAYISDRLIVITSLIYSQLIASYKSRSIQLLPYE